MTYDDPINYHALPRGTVLAFLSARGNRIVVRIVGDIMDASCGYARQVKVLEAPVKFDDSVQPTHMLAVPPGTRVSVMAYAYIAAIATIHVGDTVFLVDVHDERQNPPRFEVREVSVELP
jgi:hypothetical protein